jgi:SAM-dependent methyltransferase
VHEREGRIFRVVDESHASTLRRFAATAVGRALVDSGAVVESREVLATELSAEYGGAGGAVFEHPRVPFPSFPHEWPPEMLHAAADLTVDIAAATLESCWGIKDATPYNVMFRGARPVFIDVLSFEERDPLSPLWLPHSQFVRSFLMPLLANRTLGWPLKGVFLNQRDGLDTAALYRALPLHRRFQRSTLGLVTIPTMLDGLAGRAKPSDAAARLQSRDAGVARHTLARLFRGLRKDLERAQPISSRSSSWSGYSTKGPHAESYHRERAGILTDILARIAPRRLLDVGCNDGAASILASRAGASVVAVDRDEVSVGAAWRRAHREKADVLPLVIDFADPSPAGGWRGQERSSFIDRARGKFDTVLVLAVLHHLLVSDRLPLDDVLALLAELATKHVVIEYVPCDDPMFRSIARGRDDLFVGFTAESFEQAVRRHFRILETRAMTSSERRLYLLALA